MVRLKWSDQLKSKLVSKQKTCVIYALFRRTVSESRLCTLLKFNSHTNVKKNAACLTTYTLVTQALCGGYKILLDFIEK